MVITMDNQDWETCPICDGEGVFTYVGYEYSYKAGSHTYIADCDCIDGKIYHDDDDEQMKHKRKEAEIIRLFLCPKFAP